VDWAEGERVQSLVEQRYRCQISLHLSEYDEATQPPSIAEGATRLCCCPVDLIQTLLPQLGRSPLSQLPAISAKAPIHHEFDRPRA
jgi:hypothetical protein